MLIESFEKKDTITLNKLFVGGIDSTYADFNVQLNKVQAFFESDAMFLKMDTMNHSSLVLIDGELLLNSFNQLLIYYKKNNRFYCIKAIYDRDSIGRYSFETLFFADFFKLCEQSELYPYCPSDQIDFRNLSWTTSNYVRTFASGEIELQNNTGIDIEYIKFRIILKKEVPKNYYWEETTYETFFQQTIESNSKIYDRDIVRISIPNMENYYAGFEISSEKVTLQSTLIKVLPVPLSYYPDCEIIELLIDEGF